MNEGEDRVTQEQALATMFDEAEMVNFYININKMKVLSQDF